MCLRILSPWLQSATSLMWLAAFRARQWMEKGVTSRNRAGQALDKRDAPTAMPVPVRMVEDPDTA